MRLLLSSSCALAAGLASLAACTANDPVSREPRTEADAGSTASLPPPEMAVPESTPETTVAVRGTTEGSRVVIHSDANDPIASTVLPGGAFCRDVPLVENSANALEVYALGGDGRVSQPAEVEVVHDPAAPTPADATCSGGSSTCEAEEICDSGRDDDCNGRADFCDLACSGCVEDAYTPNHDPVDVPRLRPDTYELTICPCHDDWFAFSVEAGETIHVRAEFVNDEVDIDLTLHPAGAEGNGAAAPVDQSTGNTDSEEIEFQVEAPGLYYLRAFAYPESAMGSGDYTLTIF